MERILLNLLIIGIGIGIIYGLDKIVEYRKKKKIDRDFKYRQSDTRLAKYYGEMINERNDGWTKLHYKALYEDRLKDLKTKNK